VARCLEAGLVEGKNLSVDGSFIEAASRVVFPVSNWQKRRR
jgi:hypothetical protein